MASTVSEFPQAVVSFHVEPLGDRVLVRRDPERTETKGGIQIADNAQEKPLVGTVVARGHDVKQIQAGDRVVFGRFGGLDLPEDLDLGKDLVMLREGEILGKVHGFVPPASWQPELDLP